MDVASAGLSYNLKSNPQTTTIFAIFLFLYHQNPRLGQMARGFISISCSLLFKYLCEFKCTCYSSIYPLSILWHVKDHFSIQVESLNYIYHDQHLNNTFSCSVHWFLRFCMSPSVVDFIMQQMVGKGLILDEWSGGSCLFISVTHFDLSSQSSRRIQRDKSGLRRWRWMRRISSRVVFL